MKRITVQNENQILTRIMNLMEVKGLRQKDLADYLGLSMSSLTQWKTGKSRSYMKYLEQISELLGVDREYILNGNEEGSGNYDFSLSSNEFDIVSTYRKLSESHKAQLSGIIRLFFEAVMENGGAAESAE